VRPRLNHYLTLSNRVLSGYIRGQLIVAFILGMLYSAGLMIVGLRFGLLIGIVTGFISIIPYAGFTLGFVAALMVAITHASGWGVIFGVIAVFLTVQALEGTVITPKFVGNQVGLSSLATLLALIVGGNVFGLTGIILAIPTAAVLKSILWDLKDEYQKLDIYQ
jgi:predicted PurR-regulated permease PerM